MSQAGQISSSGGGGVSPNWNLVSTTNVSGSSPSIIINSGLTQYNEIMIEFVDVTTSAGASQWSASFSSDAGSTFLIMSSSGKNLATTAFGVVNSTTIFLSGTTSSTILGGDGYIIFDNSPILITRSGNFFITSNSSASTSRASEGALKTDSPENQINYIIISTSVGNFSGGTYNVYGR